MKKTLGLILPIIAFFLLVASYYFSAKLLSPITLTKVDEEKIQKPISFSSFGLPDPETIRFQNGSLRLRGWYFKHSKKKNCGVIFLHQFADSKLSLLPYAPMFWKLGCSLFFYDARAHGESDGTYSTYGYHEKMDLERAVEFFSEIDNTPEDRIGMFGVGFGGSTAIQFADGQYEYGFVIADAPFRDMRSYVEETFSLRYSHLIRLVLPLSLSLAELRGDFLVNDVSPLNTAKLITKPALVLFPGNTDGLEKNDAELIFANIKTKTKQLVSYQNALTRAETIKSPSLEYESHIQNFFKEYQLSK